MIQQIISSLLKQCLLQTKAEGKKKKKKKNNYLKTLFSTNSDKN